jgi:hypothetical protein
MFSIATKRAGVCATIASMILVAGCAEIIVRKVPSAGQHKAWDDARQDEADQIRGYRYYLPRPYVAVKKPFAVGGSEYLISAGGSEDGKSLVIDTASLPAELKNVFGVDASKPAATIATSSVYAPQRPRQAQANADSRVSQQVSQAGEATASTAKPRPELSKALSAEVTPAILQPDGDVFSVTVKLGKNAAITGVKPDSLKIALIPLGSDGKLLHEKAIPLTIQTTKSEYSDAKESKDGEYVANGRRSDLSKDPAASYAAGLLLRGTAPDQNAEELLLVYAPKIVMSVVAGASPAPTPSGPTRETSTKTDEVLPMSKASVTTSGDPRTNPHTSLAYCPFDIILLQDFDEQYAIEVRGGVGQATAKIGLENGWMVESVETMVDNKEMGKFIFEQIEKFVDIAADAASLALTGTPTIGGSNETAKLVSQAAESNTSLVLKVTVIHEAQPGLYPVLKPSEGRYQTPYEYETGAWLGKMNTSMGQTYLPFRPYTVVAFHTIRKVSIQILGPNESDPQQTPPQVLQPTASQPIKGGLHEFQNIRISTDVTMQVLLKDKIDGTFDTCLHAGISSKGEPEISIRFKKDVENTNELIRQAQEALNSDFRKFKTNNASEATAFWKHLFGTHWRALKSENVARIEVVQDF